GAMDVCARGLKAAAKMLEDGVLEGMRSDRYVGWDSDEGQAMLTNSSLEAIEARVLADNIAPAPISGRQELLENIVNRYV
ncbi:MAG: xylose isomerase, partial [Pseudomonadota bacterium]